MSKRRTVAALVIFMLSALHTGVRADESVQESKLAAADASKNGFSLEGSLVSAEEILPGGPARDAIASVDVPEFASPGEAHWVAASTPVIGVALGKQAHCYPVHAMEYHQIVNDVIAGEPIVLTYDPLADVGIAYRREVGDRTLTFGVSGLINNSNFLLYDRETESLWSQFLGIALTGAQRGVALSRIRTRTETFAAWRRRHPETVVMALPERRRIDYRYSRYTRYWTSNEVVFPVAAADSRYHPKELVLGVEAKTEVRDSVGRAERVEALDKGGRSRVYIASILSKKGSRIVDEFEGQKIRIEYDGETGTFVFEAPDAVQVTSAYWLAWKAFHPDTEIWGEGSERKEGAPTSLLPASATPLQRELGDAAPR